MAVIADQWRRSPEVQVTSKAVVCNECMALLRSDLVVMNICVLYARHVAATYMLDGPFRTEFVAYKLNLA